MPESGANQGVLSAVTQDKVHLGETSYDHSGVDGLGPKVRNFAEKRALETPSCPQDPLGRLRQGRIRLGRYRSRAMAHRCQVSAGEPGNKKPPIMTSTEAAPIISFPTKKPTNGTVSTA